MKSNNEGCAHISTLKKPLCNSREPTGHQTCNRLLWELKYVAKETNKATQRVTLMIPQARSKLLEPLIQTPASNICHLLLINKIPLDHKYIINL